MAGSLDMSEAGDRTADEILGELFGGAASDPFPLYDELRELGEGIHRCDLIGGHILTRYADCRQIGSDPKTFSSDMFATTAPGIYDPDDPEHRRYADTASQLFMFADPPRHTRIRSTFRHAFTPDAVRGWRAAVEQVTDEVLGRYSPGQDIDLMSGPAAEIPVAVIATILGVPQDVWAKFREWSFGYASTFDPMVFGERRDAAIRTSLELFDYLADLIRMRRAEPADDLISHMIGTETIDGTHLDDAEMLSQVALLLVAGNETTTNLIGNGMTLLFGHPEAREALAADPALVPTAVEELLRYDTPLHMTGRKVSRDTEINGHSLEAGSTVLLCLAGANRDPRAFQDAGVLDITRSPNPHLSFFHGIHFCVGAPLARLEGQVFFEKVFRAFPDIAPGSEPPVRRTLNIASRGWASRPVRL
ncbi:MAG: cytochrome P450 [Actinomycetota bacterium]|nr:cytochrome P450 [Actinomycetota bacterium]